MFLYHIFFLTGFGRLGKLRLQVGEGTDREAVEPGVAGHDGSREIGADIADLEEPGLGLGWAGGLEYQREIEG